MATTSLTLTPEQAQPVRQSLASWDYAEALEGLEHSVTGTEIEKTVGHVVAPRARAHELGELLDQFGWEESFAADIEVRLTPRDRGLVLAATLRALGSTAERLTYLSNLDADKVEESELADIEPLARRIDALASLVREIG